MRSKKPRILSIGLALSLVAGVLAATDMAQAAPYVGADLVFDGSDFAAASGQWTVDGSAVVANVDDEWVEYEVDLTAGRWTTGVDAVNDVLVSGGNLGGDPSWYPQFELSVSLSSETLAVQASDTEVHHGFVEFDVPADGTYTARFTWLNDQAEGPLPEGGFERDANLRIERVFFDAIPDLGPGQWIRNPISNHLYALTDAGPSFADAETQAQAWGGHLATINDQAEQDWLYEQFGSWNYMIGLNDIDNEGTFVWVSGEPVTYTNWCEGEPNESPPGEDAVHMVRGAQCWNDIGADGNTAIAEVESEPPRIEASLSNDWVSGVGFGPNGSVDVDLNGTVSPVDVDPNGRFWFNPGPDLVPGDTITATDTTTTKTLTLADLTFDSLNPQTDIGSGTAAVPDGTQIEVSVGNETDREDLTATVAEGTWTANFSIDITPDMGASAAIHDPDGDATVAEPSQPPPSPNFWASSAHDPDRVLGFYFAPDTLLTLTVDTGTGPVAVSDPPTTGPDGNFDYRDRPGFDLNPGDVVEVSDGATTKSLTLVGLTLDSLDYDADTASGTSDQPDGTPVEVSALEGFFLDTVTTTVTSGTWSAAFTIDLTEDMGGFAAINDPDGDATVDAIEVTEPPYPTFTVFMSADFSSTEGIRGFDFAPSSQVTLEVDLGADGSIDYEATKTVGDDGEVGFEAGVPTVQEGDVVTLTDNLDPPRVRTHVVGYFTLNQVDATADTVTGTGRAGTELHVRAFDPRLPFPDGPDVVVTVNGAGEWTADFSGIFDITVGSGGWAQTWDPVGGSHTQINWGVPVPEPGSWFYNPDTGHYYALTGGGLSFTDAEDAAQGWGGHLVTIDDQAEQDWLYQTFGPNPFWIGLNDLDVEGVFLWTSGSPVTYTNWCPDEPNDVGPGEDVVQMTRTFGERCWNDVPGTGSGSYGIAEITGEPPEPNPFIGVGSAGVFGRGWTDGTTVTLTINGELIGSTQVQVGSALTGADFQFGPAVEAGDVVVVEDNVPAPNTTTRTHIARSVSVSPPNMLLDKVFGTGPPGESMGVNIWTADFGVTLGTRYVTAGPTGDWEADFATVGPGPDEQDVVSLANRAVVVGTSPDAEGNNSYAYWAPQPPRIQATSADNPDRVEGNNFAPGTEITLTVDTGTGPVPVSDPPTTDAFGNFNYDSDLDLDSGDVVEVSDGATTKSLTLVGLTFDVLDYGADTASGTSDQPDDTPVRVHAGNNTDDEDTTTTVTGGTWTADFTIDITPDMWAQASIAEPDGDETIADAPPPPPSPNIWASSANDPDRVLGFNFAPDTLLTLTVDTGAGPVAVSDPPTTGPDGNFDYRDRPGFDLNSGDIVEVSDGATTRSLTLVGLTFDAFDYDADTASGTSDQPDGTPVFVQVYSPGGQALTTTVTCRHLDRQLHHRPHRGHERLRSDQRR